MPDVVLKITDRSGNITEFALNHNMTTPNAIESQPKIRSAIKALYMWEDWLDAYLQIVLPEHVRAAIVSAKRDQYEQDIKDFQDKKKEKKEKA